MTWNRLTPRLRWYLPRVWGIRSVAEIADRTRRSPNSIRRYAIQLGLPIGRSGRPRMRCVDLAPGTLHWDCPCVLCTRKRWERGQRYAAYRRAQRKVA